MTLSAAAINPHEMRAADYDDWVTETTSDDGIGQSRTFMLPLKKAHLGEVSATVWPKVLKDMCKKKSIHVIE